MYLVLIIKSNFSFFLDCCVKVGSLQSDLKETKELLKLLLRNHQGIVDGAKETDFNDR